MTLAFFEFTAAEISLLLFVLLLTIVPLGYYGKNTALGYRGTVLLALLSTPVTALIIVLILRSRQRKGPTIL